jgi:hypothetical protein
MRSSFHDGGEGIMLYSHSNSSHLSCSSGCFHHHISPLVHLCFPVGELSGDDLRDVVGNLCRSFTNSPEKAPFGIELRWELRQRMILFRDLLQKLLMVPSFLNSFGGDASLEVEFRLAVDEGLATVELF